MAFSVWKELQLKLVWMNIGSKSIRRNMTNEYTEQPVTYSHHYIQFFKCKRMKKYTKFPFKFKSKSFFLLFVISIEQMFALKNTNWMHTVQRKQYLQHVIISVYVFSHLVTLFVLKIITFLGWNINGFCVKKFCFFLPAFTNNTYNLNVGKKCLRRRLKRS